MTRIPKDRILGPYELLEILGEGANGRVYKARHRAMNRLVALKVLRPDEMPQTDTVARFCREIEVLSQLSHPNIIHAYDAGTINGSLVLVMELLDGATLEDLVQRTGPLPVPLACEYVRQAAVGLQHAHERGLIHRDIKPANLMVVSGKRAATSNNSTPVPSRAGSDQPQATLKILDLGLARLMAPRPGSTSASLTLRSARNVTYGTPDYMAPEQAMDFHGADIRGDIYSLGCTFYFLLSGQPPFPASSMAEKLVAHQMKEPRPIRSVRGEVPADVAAVLARMLAKRPEDRFQTPAELAAALASLPSLRKHPAAAPIPTGRAATVPAILQRRQTWTAIALAVLLFSLGVWVLASLSDGVGGPRSQPAVQQSRPVASRNVDTRPAASPAVLPGESPNLALNRPTTVSSSRPDEGSGAVDGRADTSWKFQVAGQPVWLTVDLGSPCKVREVKLEWVRFPADYEIQTSGDNSQWQRIAQIRTASNKTESFTGLAVQARYLRVLCLKRGSGDSCYLRELEVFGDRPAK